MSGTDGELEVAEILGERKTSRRGLEYLVRWKDFGVSNDSWEPLKNLTNAVAAIAEFHSRAFAQKSKAPKRTKSRSRSRSRSRGRSGSRSPGRGKKKASPSRSSLGRKSSTNTTTTTTTKTSPTQEETKTATVTRSPGKFEKTTETLTRSVLTPSATQRSTHVTRTSEVRTSTSNEPAKSAQSTCTGRSWLQACCTPVNKMKECCTGLINSDYPAIVVFTTIAVILLTFVLERNVDFEKVWSSIVAFFAGVWAWLSQLVSK